MTDDFSLSFRGFHPLIPPPPPPYSHDSTSVSRTRIEADQAQARQLVESRAIRRTLWRGNVGPQFLRREQKGPRHRALEDDEEGKEVSLFEVIEGLRDRGTHLPVLLRFRDLLHSRITEINESFRKAIKDTNYRGEYRGVYPIKVNQQRQVIEEIAEFGNATTTAWRPVPSRN
jgi:arginine decarboxylase-like protein